MKCIECEWCKKGYFYNEPEQYGCVGVKHPFVIQDIKQECTEYSHLRDKQNFDFNIPKTQTLWVAYLTDGKPKYIVTINSTKTQYTLWKVENSRNVVELEVAKEPVFKTKL